MWSPIQKFLGTEDAAAAAGARVPPVPLRKHGVNFADIIVGSVIRFSSHCSLPQLQGKIAQVRSIRHYQFGEDTVASFRLSIGKNTSFSFSLVNDAQGQYLAISRQLNVLEQDEWFGRDALSFFTEASTAKTIRCKADLEIEKAWAAPRYVKTVDWVEGHLSDGRQQTAFRYNLLLNEAADKALEVEHYPALQKNKIYVTVYRPLEDITSINEPSGVPELPEAAGGFNGKFATGGPREMKTNGAQGLAHGAHYTSNGAEQPLFTCPLPFPLNQAANQAPNGHHPHAPQENMAETRTPRPDFRRASEPEEIHIPSSALAMSHAPENEQSPPLPSFLLSREHNYLSLDAVITPETEQVRCGLLAARQLIDSALTRGVRVRDVMRELVGLHSVLSDEVVFEMPLSDADYRQLAQRYKLRPDHRDEIRARLQRELQAKLLGLPE